MPRAGSGGGHSSSHRSSGSHSSSRSSGGHRVSSGSHSRAGSGRSSGFHSGSSYHSRGPSFHGAPPPPPFGGPGMPPPPQPKYYRQRYTRTYYSGSSSGSGLLTSIVALIIILSVAFSLLSAFISLNSYSGSSSVPASTRNREKLDSGLAFDSNCIVDELSWFDSVSRAGTRLKSFYDKTGVQPYIVLLKYHPELTTDSQKEDYALEYYENNIDNEATFLYMYFAEEDQDNDVGYMCYVNGKQVDSVMDSEAVEIFWGYIDRSWYSDASTDTLFADAFEKTADTIMQKSKTTTDVIFAVVVGIVIILVITAIISAMVIKRRHERERAEETQRILNTPLPDNPLSSQGTTTTTSDMDQTVK